MDEHGRHSEALIVSVHYKADEGVLALLGSLQRQTGFEDLDVIIVDNSTREQDLSLIRSSIAQLSNTQLIESPTNRGYFGAAGFALEQYLAERHSLPGWVIVCNHDVVIEDRDFFSRLFRQDPLAVGMIAPRIRTSQGTDQNPFMRRRPGFCRRASMRFYSCHYRLAVFWDWLSRRKQSLRSLLKVARKGAAGGSWPSSETIYAPHGAFMIFSHKYFESGGYLDSKLFLYGEEIASAEICRSLNLRVLYDPALEVIHREHASTGEKMNRRSYEHHRSTVAYLMSKYLAK